MADIIQFPRPPQPTDGDGEGPTEIVVRLVFESGDDARADDAVAAEDESDEEPPAKSKVGWGWFWLGALLGLGLGG